MLFMKLGCPLSKFSIFRVSKVGQPQKAIDLKSGITVVVKCEHTEAKYKLLLLEYQVYKDLFHKKSALQRPTMVKFLKMTKVELIKPKSGLAEMNVMVLEQLGLDFDKCMSYCKEVSF